MSRNKGQIYLLSTGYLVVGACLCLLPFFLDLQGTNSLVLANTFFLMFILLIIFSSVCLYSIFKGKIEFPRPVCMFGITACTLIVSAGLTEFIFYRLPVYHQLSINVTEEQNISSLGKEVWLVGRRHDFNQVFDIDALQFSSGWQTRTRDMVSVGHSADTATWSGKVHTDLTIAFLKHEFSGVVEVIWDDIKTSYDLYSSTRGYTSIVLPKTQNESAWLTLKLLFCITMVLLWWLSGLWFLATPSIRKDLD